jgi:hypothetical protein
MKQNGLLKQSHSGGFASITPENDSCPKKIDLASKRGFIMASNF